MAKTRSLKELFNIVKEHHAYFNSEAGYTYMCHAAYYVCIDKSISEEEHVCVRDACMALVHSYEERASSLEGALQFVGKISDNTPKEEVIEIIKEVWETYINSLE